MYIKDGIITLVVLLLTTINTFAQSNNMENSPNTSQIKTTAMHDLKYSSYGLRNYDAYNKEALNYQYGAIGCATVSAGLLIGFACVKDRYYTNDSGKLKMNTKSKALVIGGSVFAALAIISELHVIDCKIEAKRGLILHLNENGAKLSYAF
ncbi:MAG: hypothetical protein DBX48_08795 [Limosilactobacillus fermentum]|nr:MAG: hypothetical protein DBX48_08795 [Limosilactobacillus fermentum]